MTRSCTFSRALCQLHVFVSSFDWITGLSISFVIGQSRTLLLVLKELRYDVRSHFFDGLNCGLSVEKPKNVGLLREKNAKGLSIKQKGTRMAEDGKD